PPSPSPLCLLAPLPTSPVHRGLPIFDYKAGNGRVFHHVGVIDLIHSRHSASGVPAGEIALEQIELFGGRPPAAFGDDEVLVPAQDRKSTRLNSSHVKIS